MEMIKDVIRERELVSVQRSALEPTRQRAVDYLDAFNKVVAERRPDLENAFEKYQKAYTEHGINLPDLGRTILAARLVLEQGGNGFRGVIEEIDNLDAYTINQGWHRLIPARLESFHPNIGELERLSQIVMNHLPLLEEMIRNAPKVQPLTDRSAYQHPVQRVVNEFEPRMRL